MSSHTKGGGLGSVTATDIPANSKVNLDPRLAARGFLDDSPFLVIIRVNPGYVPDCVALREQISPRMITAQVRPSALKILERDPKVLSVSSSQPLR